MVSLGECQWGTGGRGRKDGAEEGDGKEGGVVACEAVCVMLMCVARRRLRVRNTHVRDLFLFNTKI